jgi:hypothetical protein
LTSDTLLRYSVLIQDGGEFIPVFDGRARAAPDVDDIVRFGGKNYKVKTRTWHAEAGVGLSSASQLTHIPVTDLVLVLLFCEVVP